MKLGHKCGWLIFFNIFLDNTAKNEISYLLGNVGFWGDFWMKSKTNLVLKDNIYLDIKIYFILVCYFSQSNAFICHTFQLWIMIACIVLFQEMVYVAVGTVSAGKAGQEMHVKSGLGQSTPNNTMEDGRPKDFWFG